MTQKWRWDKNEDDPATSILEGWVIFHWKGDSIPSFRVQAVFCAISGMKRLFLVPKKCFYVIIFLIFENSGWNWNFGSYGWLESFFRQFITPLPLINMFQCIYELYESPQPIWPLYPFTAPLFDRGFWHTKIWKICKSLLLFQ